VSIHCWLTSTGFGDSAWPLEPLQHAPIGRCRDLTADGAGSRVSAGFIRSCVREAAEPSGSARRGAAMSGGVRGVSRYPRPV